MISKVFSRRLFAEVAPHLLVIWCCCLLPCFEGNAQKAVQDSIIRALEFKVRHATPESQANLEHAISEGSGLVAWNGQLWTHNDSGPARIFALDSSNGKIVKTFDLQGVKNDDWEDMSQDKRFLYIGNFGNNTGRKPCLQIYRISKEALLQDKVVLDSISFDWPTITDSGRKRKINFDCEAMAVMHDTVFLFTKEWKFGSRSRVFKVPATAGNFTASYVAAIRTHMLVSGASYWEAQNRLVLCGYSLLLGPRLLVLSLRGPGNFRDIVSGKRIRIRKAFKQTEGITTFDGLHYYVVSEAATFLFWKNKPQLFKIKVNE